ncbi:MAG TPA: LamG-like jellyroll fold domain-containing protein, partial [Pirellulales bacterium]|nr:LamG-like jellyroll fold domain-containing protein [Pirellulales bacterium]
APSAREFHLVTITWGPNGVAAYRDGWLVATDKAIQAVSSDPQITALRIGGPGSGGAPRFRGELAELRVYSAPLDAAKRNQIEAELRQRWFEADLLAERPFDPIADLYQELLSPRGPYWVVEADRAKLSLTDGRPTDASGGSKSESDSWAEDGTDGKPLNLDFESGTLADWEAEGEAFAGQPVEGDTVVARRFDMRSQHAGRFWIGTYERAGDQPQGCLTSVSFRVTHPYASFLVAGGPHQETCVQIVLKDSGKTIYQVSGDSTENLKPVAIDLREHQGMEIFIRLVDRHSGPWGHINFDDFRFHEAEPSETRVGPVPSRRPAAAWDAHEGSPVQPTDNWVQTPNELAAGDRVLVEQAGAWWRGRVKSVAADGSVAIHYVGWGSSWDESVPVSRLQLP